SEEDLLAEEHMCLVHYWALRYKHWAGTEFREMVAIAHMVQVEENRRAGPVAVGSNLVDKVAVRVER
ncbi:hypothetical protein FRC00_003812, partial [Tulasnella sp. 408]